MAPKLSEDEIDDLVYFARTGESSDFRSTIDALCSREGCALAAVLDAAVDADSGNGALHMAAANGHTGRRSGLTGRREMREEARLTGFADIIAHVVATVGPEKPELVALLNKRNKAGNTALHWAALNGHLEAVKALVDGGADPYIQNNVGHDAIYEAEVNDKKEAVEWMLKEGDLDAYDEAVGAEGEGGAEDGEGEGQDEEVSEEGLREQLDALAVGEGKGKEKASS